MKILLLGGGGREHALAWKEYRPPIERACRAQGYAAPVLCTPDELMGGGGES